MIRLADKYMEPHTILQPTNVDDDLAHRVREEVRGLIRRATKFNIDNVTRFMEESTKESFHASDFPNLAPPFEIMWFDSEWCHHPFSMCGTLVLATSGSILPKNVPPFIHQYISMWGDRLVKIGTNKGEAKWTMFSMAFLRRSDGSISIPVVWEVVWIAPDGKLLDAANRGLAEKSGEGYSSSLYVTMAAVYMAISLMHCKNVTHEEVSQSKTVERAYTKRHDRPPFRHHVLNITPMRKVLSDSAPRGTKLSSAMHICRGHFKDYTKSGLFGRIPGIFWWDSNLRCKNSDRMVSKDYKVSAEAG